MIKISYKMFCQHLQLCYQFLSPKFKFKFIAQIISKSGPKMTLNDHRYYMKTLLPPSVVWTSPSRRTQTSPNDFTWAVFLHLVKV